MDVRVNVEGGRVSLGIVAALRHLLWVRHDALGLHVDLCQFAVELNPLIRASLRRTDLRWLPAAGLAEHREDKSRPETSTRMFQTLSAASIPPRTRVLLTDRGCCVLSALAPLHAVTRQRPVVRAGISTAAEGALRRGRSTRMLP